MDLSGSLVLPQHHACSHERIDTTRLFPRVALERNWERALDNDEPFFQACRELQQQRLHPRAQQRFATAAIRLEGGCEDDAEAVLCPEGEGALEATKLVIELLSQTIFGNELATSCELQLLFGPPKFLSNWDLHHVHCSSNLGCQLVQEFSCSLLLLHITWLPTREIRKPEQDHFGAQLTFQAPVCCTEGLLVGSLVARPRTLHQGEWEVGDLEQVEESPLAIALREPPG